MLCDNCVQKSDYLLHESWDLSETDIILHAMFWSVCKDRTVDKLAESRDQLQAAWSRQAVFRAL